MAEIDHKEIETKVKEVLSKTLGIRKENITPDKRLIEDLGMDSFASIELIFELEDKIGIEVTEADVPSLKAVKDIISYITSRLSEKEDVKNI